MNIHDLSHANVDFVTYTNDNALIFKRMIKYINEQIGYLNIACSE